MTMLSNLFNIFLLAAMTSPGLAHAQKEGLSGAGSTFAAAAYTSWGLSYAKEKNMTVVYKATGSGDGIRQILARNVDFGASDYAMSADELKEKFHSLVDPILPAGRPGEIIDAVDNVEKIKNVNELAQLLVVPPATRIKAVA